MEYKDDSIWEICISSPLIQEHEINSKVLQGKKCSEMGVPPHWDSLVNNY